MRRLRDDTEYRDEHRSSRNKDGTKNHPEREDVP